MSLYLKAENVKPNNRESLLNALRSMSDFDCDFNGEMERNLHGKMQSKTDLTTILNILLMK